MPDLRSPSTTRESLPLQMAQKSWAARRTTELTYTPGQCIGTGFQEAMVATRPSITTTPRSSTANHNGTQRPAGHTFYVSMGRRYRRETEGLAAVIARRSFLLT